jgi:purine-cytosine permease-like protein
MNRASIHHEKALNPYLIDTNQSIWSLTAIQLAGWLSLPILATGVLILEDNSFLGAVLTVIVGNAILWFIRLGIIAMSQEARQSSLDLAHNYLGKIGSYFVAIALLLSTLAWFVSQTTVASNVLTHLISFNGNSDIDRFSQVSVLLGILTAFLCINGISLLRKLSAYSFPILILAFFIILFYLPNGSYKENNNALSLSGLSLVLATNLGVTAELPTFFRHSRSWKTSVKALLIIQLACLGLGLFSLFMGSIINNRFEISDSFLQSDSNSVLRISLMVFIFLSTICANVANVYSSSVGWEILAPKSLVGKKEYLILGLSLTIIFVLISGLFSLEFLLHAADSALVNLSIVLIAGYIIAKRQKTTPHLFEKVTYFFSWFVPTILNTLQFGLGILPNISPFALSLFLSLIIIFSSFFGRFLILKKST